MNYTAEQLIATNQANVRALEGLTIQGYAGFEKLSELNQAFSKTALAESFSHVQDLFIVKTPLQLLALQVGLVQPLAERYAAYGRQVYTIAAETGAEFTKTFDAKLSEAKITFSEAVENLTRNAPVGTETAVAAFKSAVNASQTIIESAQSSARSAATVVESSLAAAADQSVNAATLASRKR